VRLFSCVYDCSIHSEWLVIREKHLESMNCFFYNDGTPNDPTKGCALSLYNIITRRIPVHFMHELDLHVIVSVHVKTGQANAIIQ